MLMMFFSHHRSLRGAEDVVFFFFPIIYMYMHVHREHPYLHAFRDPVDEDDPWTSLVGSLSDDMAHVWGALCDG